MYDSFFIVICTFCVLLILIYISTFYKKSSLLDRFVTRLPIASHFVIGIGIYVTFLIFKLNNEDSTTRQTIQSIKDTFIQTLDILEKYRNKCPNLINSFFYSWQKPNENKYNRDSLNEFNNKDDSLYSLIVSNYIFQIVGFYIHSSYMTKTSDSRFLVFFSSFFKSKLLKEEWYKYNANFGLRTRLLCNKLFEINDEIDFQSSDEIREYFEKYITTDKYKYIMAAKDETNVMQTNDNIF